MINIENILKYLATLSFICLHLNLIAQLDIQIDSKNYFQIQDSIPIKLKLLNSSNDTLNLWNDRKYLEICELRNNEITKCEILNEETFGELLVLPNGVIEFEFDITNDYYNVDDNDILTIVCNYNIDSVFVDMQLTERLSTSNKLLLEIKNSIDPIEYEKFVNIGRKKMVEQCYPDIICQLYIEYINEYPEGKLKPKAENYISYYESQRNIDQQIKCLEFDLQFNSHRKDLEIKNKLNLALLYNEKKDLVKLNKLLVELVLKLENKSW